MKTSALTLQSILALGALAFLASVDTARSQGTTFTYQGRLVDAGSPAVGNYDLRFTVWDSAVGGLQVGPPVVVAPVPVSSGLFAVPLNFGGTVFTGPPRWLQIESRVFGGGVYSLITPRQALTAAPYAIAAGSLTTPITVTDAGLSANVALLNRNPQSFTGQNNFNNIVGIGTIAPAAVLDVFGTRDIGAARDGIVNIGNSGGLHVTLDNNEIHARSGAAPSDLFINDFGGNVYIANSAIYAASAGNVGIGTTAPAEKLTVNGNISYAGQLTKLDVADNFVATVRAADFTLGYSGRRGSPGRALVDFGTSLIVNYGPDWPETIVASRLTVTSSDMFVGKSKIGHFFGASAFNFNPANTTAEGLMIEQGFSSGSESSGIYMDGDSITMWSPGDNNRLLSILDEDGMIERFYISGSGQAVANGVILTSSRRFKENVAPIANALDKVTRLKGVTFDWVQDRGGKAGIGFIAEEVADVLPELVEWEANGKDAVGLQYANVTAVAVEAIKELKQQKDLEIETLQKKNARMEGELAALEAKEKARESRLTALETQLQQLLKDNPAINAKQGGDR